MLGSHANANSVRSRLSRTRRLPPRAVPGLRPFERSKAITLAEAAELLGEADGDRLRRWARSGCVLGGIRYRFPVQRLGRKLVTMREWCESWSELVRRARG